MGGIRKFLAAVLTVSLCFLFTVGAAAATTTSVKLSQSAVTLTVGQKTTLKATVSPSSYASLTGWATSNAAVATVNASGVVGGVKAGSCVVSVTVKGVTAKCTVTVKSAATVSCLDPVHAVTVVGRAPTLPSTVRAEMSDGTTKDISVKWNSVASSLYAGNGTFVVTGTASGVSYPAVAYVDVKTSSGAAYIVTVEPVTAATTVGVAPALPSTVTIVLSDGSKRSYPVTWTTPAASKYAKTGVFTVNGSVNTSAVPAVAVVTVSEGSAIASLNAATVTTAVGTAPALPSTVTAVLADGTKESVAVTWDAVAASQYASAGTFTVSGTVSGTTLKAVATVTVTDSSGDVASIEPVAVTTIVGTAPTLPTTVTAVLSSGATESLAVTWASVSSSQYSSSGTFTVTGTVSGTTLTATATVTVTAASAAITYVEPVQITTTVGQAPVLPSLVTVDLVGGTKENLSVIWNSVSASSYAATGVFTVSGTVSGTTLPATAVVTVTTSSVTSIVSIDPVMLYTTIGTAPSLPTTVNAVMSDGSRQSEYVTWNALSSTQYYTLGTFSVTGTVTGTTIAASAIVTVKASGTTVSSVQPILVTTTVGTPPSLPSTVTAFMSDGTTQTLSVVWNAITTSQYYTVGTFTVTGTVVGIGYAASATVTVLI